MRSDLTARDRFPLCACGIVAALAALCVSLLPAAPDALMELGDGDFLRGEPVGLQGDTLAWNHRQSGTVFSYPLAAIRAITFSARDEQLVVADTLVLDNQDVLVGSIESLDMKIATLRNDLGGTLQIPRSRLRTVRLAADHGADGTYIDAGDLKGWVTPEGKPPVAWQAKDGVLSLRSGAQETIGRELTMPAVARISFELAWKESRGRGATGPLGTMVFCANSTKEPGTSGYSLAFNRNWLTVSKANPGNKANQTTLDRMQLMPFTDGRRNMRVTLLVDRNTRKIRVQINGTDAGEVRDESPGSTDGSCLLLVGDTATNIRLRNLRVQPWSGSSGSGGDQSSPPAQDLLVAVDGDEIFGEIRAMRRDAKLGRVVEIAHAASASTPITVPSTRVRQLAFATKDAPPSPAGAVLRLDDGSKLSGKPLGIEDGMLVFDCVGLGRLRVPIARLLSMTVPSSSAPAVDGPGTPPDPQE